MFFSPLLPITALTFYSDYGGIGRFNLKQSDDVAIKIFQQAHYVEHGWKYCNRGKLP